MQEGTWELGMQQSPPRVTLNVCQRPVTQPAGSVIYGGDDGLGKWSLLSGWISEDLV